MQQTKNFSFGVFGYTPLVTIGQTANSVPNPPNPKIRTIIGVAVALKGLAHIGVLKWWKHWALK